MAKPIQINKKGISPYYENLAKRFNAGDLSLTPKELKFLTQMSDNPKLYNGNKPLTMDHVKANANANGNNKLNTIQKALNAENAKTYGNVAKTVNDPTWSANNQQTAYKPTKSTMTYDKSVTTTNNTDFTLQGKPYSKEVGPYRGSTAVSTTNINTNTSTNTGSTSTKPNTGSTNTNTKLPSVANTSTSTKGASSLFKEPMGGKIGNVFKGALSNPMGIPVIASAIDNFALDPFRDAKSKNVADADFIIKTWQENLGMNPDNPFAKFGRDVSSTVLGKLGDYGRDAFQIGLNGLTDTAKLALFGTTGLGEWLGLIDPETRRKFMLSADEYLTENSGDALVKEYFGDKYLPEKPKATDTNGADLATLDANAIPQLLPPANNTQNKEVANNTKTPVSIDEAINNILTKGINGPDRIKYLQSLGLNPAEVQQRINAMMRTQPSAQPTTMQQVQQVLNREAVGMPSYLPNSNQPIVNTPIDQPVEIPSWNIGNNASLPSGIRDMYNYAIRSGMSPREAEMYVRGY